MVKTGRLRELLNEHGVEWIDDSYAQFLCTVWPGQDGKQWRMLERKGSEYTELKTWYATPEQAIAATLGPGTCRNVSHRLDESRFHCSECGCGGWWKDVADGHDKVPHFCPNCGRKVIN